MVSFDRAIPPGGQGKIILQVNTDDFLGDKGEQASVETNDPDNPKFDIAMNYTVQAVFKREPQQRLILQTPVGTPAESVLTFTNLLNHPVEIIGVRQNLGPDVSVRIEPVTKGKVYNLIVSTKALAIQLINSAVYLQLQGVPASELLIHTHIRVFDSKPKGNSNQSE